MLNNPLNIEQLNSQINAFALSERLNQVGYKDLFYEHLTGLTKFKMLSDANNIDELVLNQKNYFGLEQFVFEHPTFVEKCDTSNEINWDLIDEAKDLLQDKLINSLGIKDSYYQSDFKPLVKFTVNNYENFLIYDFMYPDSVSNPWIPTKTITFNNGYLLLVSDQKDMVRELNKKIIEKAETEDDSSDLFVLVKNKINKEVGGFAIDTRNNAQGLVFDYLKREASGLKNAVKTEKIALFLRSQQKIYTEQEVRVRVLLPLKRAGLIGSTTNGYFYIDSPDDLRHTYRHHKEKLLGLQRTLDMYSNRAKLMGISL